MKSKFCPHCGGELPDKDERSVAQKLGISRDDMGFVLLVVIVAAVLIAVAMFD